MNEAIFTSPAQACSVLAAWRHDYNHQRPQSSLGNKTPAEMAALAIGQPVCHHAHARASTLRLVFNLHPVLRCVP